jgi:hypothetical protein
MKRTKTLSDRYEKYQWIGYGVGGGLLVTSVVFLSLGYLWHPSVVTADGRGSSIQFAPMFSRESAGAMALMTF